MSIVDSPTSLELSPFFQTTPELEEQLTSARKTIQSYLSPSPLVYSSYLSELVRGHVWLKLENFLPNGSFKVRGALKAMAASLGIEAGKKFESQTASQVRSFCAASAGNHAQGVAFAAQKMGCEAHIFLPKTTPLVKREATAKLGAKVYIEGNVLEESFRAALAFSQQTGATFLHPFNNYDVILGGSTCAQEALEQFASASKSKQFFNEDGSAKKPIFLCSVGGGGFISGTTLATTALQLGSVIGVEVANFDSAYQSMKHGEYKGVSLPGKKSIADGISVGKIGDICYKILKHFQIKMELVSEDEVASSILLLLEKDRIVTEGAGATPVAFLVRNKKMFQNENVIINVSGGNIDPQLLSRIIVRGLSVTGRVQRLTVKISDKPGQLRNLLDIAAQLDANVLEVHHERTYRQVFVGDVEVELVLETKDFEHQYEIFSRLSEHGFTPQTVSSAVG